MDFTWVKRKDCKVLLQDSTLVIQNKYSIILTDNKFTLFNNHNARFY